MSLKRVGALTTAVGVLAIGGPSGVAMGQTASPPPLNPSVTAPGGLQSFNYPQQQACMGSGGSGAIAEKPWSQQVLGIDQLHIQGLTGQGKSVAVVDTGVNHHPRLPNLQDGPTSIPDGRGSQDCDGHGTIVAGIIGGQQDPTAQDAYVGVAPDASILSIRQTSGLFKDQETNQTIGNTETMAQAINYAVDRHVDVINISQSSCQPIAQASNYNDTGNQMLHNAVVRAYNAGIVVVAAAGNVGGQCQKNPTGNPTTAVLPAWFDKYVLTVSSTNRAGAPSEFDVPGPWVDVAAPGEGLIALDPGVGGTGLATQVAEGGQGQKGPVQGTSFAAPYVSGLAVLIKQKFPDLTADEIMERIKTTALHPGGANGKNDIVGYGMIDPQAAVADVVPAEHGKNAPPPHPTRLAADALQRKDVPAIVVAIGGAGAGIAAIVFVAFLTNAVRNVRARARRSED